MKIICDCGAESKFEKYENFPEEWAKEISPAIPSKFIKDGKISFYNDCDGMFINCHKCNKKLFLHGVCFTS